MTSDFYSILGVSKNVTDDELKRAYKKQAVKWHPDKNPDNKEQAEEMFKKVGEAYSVLSDPQKRQIYDAYGEEGLKGGGVPSSGDGPGPGFQSYSFNSANAADLFAQMFGYGGLDGLFGGLGGGSRSGNIRVSSMGGMGGLGGMFGGGFDDQMMHKRKSPPVQSELPVSLADLMTGTVKHIKITQSDDSSEVLDIPIRAGLKEGSKITFEGKGNQTGADLVFVVKQIPHTDFTREGDDLVVTRTISLSEALLGTTVDITVLDKSRVLRVRIKEIVRPGYEKVVHGEGMPKKNGGKGNLIIRFNVLFPSSASQSRWSDQDRMHLERLLSQ